MLDLKTRIRFCCPGTFRPGRGQMFERWSHYRTTHHKVRKGKIATAVKQVLQEWKAKSNRPSWPRVEPLWGSVLGAKPKGWACVHLSVCRLSFYLSVFLLDIYYNGSMIALLKWEGALVNDTVCLFLQQNLHSPMWKPMANHECRNKCLVKSAVWKRREKEKHSDVRVSWD